MCVCVCVRVCVRVCERVYVCICVREGEEREMGNDGSRGGREG